MDGRVGVVLAAGGARGAYEVGVLLELAPMLTERGEWPGVFSGASVGAINALTAAGMAHLPVDEQAERGVARWREVVKSNVFRSVTVHALELAARYAADFATRGHGRVASFLDSAPLRRHLSRWVDWDALRANVAGGHVTAVAAIAAGAYSGRCTAFFDGDERLRPADASIQYVRTRLRPEHVAAAAAIPTMFPAVHVDDEGDASGWYVDGGTRLRSPAQPAFDLGAERLILITSGSFAQPSAGKSDHGPQPSVADVAATTLHAMALDPIEDDARALAERGVPHIAIGPSEPGSIGRVAEEVLQTKYRSPRRALSEFGLIDRLTGGATPLHGELMSFLLFDRDFIDALLEMGRADARRWIEAHPDLWVA